MVTKIKPNITIVSCLHGDEQFGERVLDYYRQRASQYPNVRLITANPKAVLRNARFIDTDMNRCFPGDSAGSYEQRRAAELVQEIQDADYVIDIHTTTAQIKMTPIVANLGPGVRHVVNLCSSREIVQVGKKLASSALIGNVKNGVSLEFNQAYAETDQALGEVTTIVDRLLQGIKLKRRQRYIFRASKKIPLSAQLPSNASNFEYLADLDLYPFLIGEKSYIDFQGFAAKRYQEALL